MNIYKIYDLCKIFLFIFISFLFVDASSACDEDYAPGRYQKAPIELDEIISSAVSKNWENVTTQELKNRHELTQQGYKSRNHCHYMKPNTYQRGGPGEVFCMSNGVCSVWGAASYFPTTLDITKSLNGKFFTDDIFNSFNDKFHTNVKGKVGSVGTGYASRFWPPLKYKIRGKYIEFTMEAVGTMDDGSGHELENTIIKYIIRDETGKVENYQRCTEENKKRKEAGKNLEL